MIDYKTIISTTDSKVTLMQWLQALTEEFGEAQITDVTFTNDSNKSLTFTFKLEDGTTKTAAIELHSLTADEQSLINNLIKSVTASSDGVTFSKAVSFQGNESHNGSEIHNGYASFLGDENHAGSEMHKGTATFTDLRSDDLTATDGQELVSWDGTTTALKGKADRPTYNGGVLALKSDVTQIQGLAVQRWAGKHYYDDRDQPANVVDEPCNGLTDFTGYMAWSGVYTYQGNSLHTRDIHFNANLFTNGNEFHEAFCGFQNTGTMYLPTITIKGGNLIFFNSKLSKLLVEDGATVKFSAFCYAPFEVMSNLTEMGAIDFSDAAQGYGLKFSGCPNLKTLHCTHWHFSFDISGSTAFEQADLVEIIGNLDLVSTTQTLTMGTTNLKKLTEDQILVATGKGWALA